MSRRWRVLIVGAGPAGSAAAQVLARGGLEVILVESSRFDEPRIGELLSPEGQLTMERLLPDRFQEFYLTQIGIVGAWAEPALRRFADPSWWALDRVGLDRALAERARDLGAELHIGCKVQKLVRREAVWHFRLDDHDREADWLLIATGRSGQVSRQLGAQIQKFDRQIALAGFLEGEYRSSMDMLLETTPSGWWYGAPIDAKRAVAVFLTDSDLDRGDPQQAWEARLAESVYAKERFGHMSLLAKPSRGASGFSLLVPSYGDGWAAIGEAASSFDPLSNLGIGRAADTGEKVAELILEAAHTSRHPDFLLNAEKVGSEFAVHSGVLIDDYRKVHHFPGSVFWARRVSEVTGSGFQRQRSKPTQIKKLHFPPGQNFDCTNCGKCCRSPWVATVELSKAKQMEFAPETSALARKKCTVPLRVLHDGRLATNVDPEGHCVFLEQNSSLCGLQDTGLKPKSCSQFPFLLRDTPDGVVVGVSFLCSSVQKNEGRPLEAYTEELQNLLLSRAPAVLPRYVPISWGRGVEWDKCATLDHYLLGGEDPIERIRNLRWYLAHWLQKPGSDDFELSGPVPREWLIELERQMSLSLLSRIEFGFAQSQQSLFDGLLDGRPVELCKVGWQGQVKLVQERYRVEYQPWIYQETKRFLKALLHRKFLYFDGPVYHNLLVLSAIPKLLILYAAIYAAKREAEQVSLEDYHGALDMIELELTAHSKKVSAAQTFFYWHMGLLRQGFAEARPQFLDQHTEV